MPGGAQLLPDRARLPQGQDLDPERRARQPADEVGEDPLGARRGRRWCRQRGPGSRTRRVAGARIVVPGRSRPGQASSSQLPVGPAPRSTRLRSRARQSLGTVAVPRSRTMSTVPCIVWQRLRQETHSSRCASNLARSSVGHLAVEEFGEMAVQLFAEVLVVHAHRPTLFAPCRSRK